MERNDEQTKVIDDAMVDFLVLTFDLANIGIVVKNIRSIVIRTISNTEKLAELCPTHQSERHQNIWWIRTSKPNAPSR